MSVCDDDITSCFLQAYYYCAIVEDVILRFSWTLQIALTNMTNVSSADIVATALAPLEVFRYSHTHAHTYTHSHRVQDTCYCVLLSVCVVGVSCGTSSVWRTST